ncbi:MAG: single-stranded-DNA-specific exonuclease RecJ, partial [Candidatus Wallbacteria bacterium]|nr:single-stranded-DNA-specific exonuclease RecJ [Candidatus Wallbacteria bacterium]
ILERQCMGYGLNIDSIKRLKQTVYDLIITVDCGISNVEEVRFAKELGIDVIITDHHEPLDVLPPAVAVLNPKRPDEKYPYKFLSGVGVAFKLFQKLLKDFNFSDHYIYNNLDLVALGTIADIVPLTGENRIIARYGLKKLKKTDNVGVSALIKISGLSPGDIDSSDVAFIMAPRINACGRIDDPKLAVRLLTTENKEEAAFLARRLDEINRRRQKIELDIMREAEQIIIKDNLQNEAGLVLYSKDWHAGVIGIVTSKLKEKFYRPVVLISFDSEIGRASARSIDGFPLHRELSLCSDLLEKFGGHEMAAGFTIKRENIETFKTKFQELVAERLGGEVPFPNLQVDSELDFNEINEELIQSLEALAPFGMKNQQPVFVTNDISVLESSLVGNNKKHLKLRVKKNGRQLNCIGFNLQNFYEKLYSPAQSINLAYSLSLNRFQNETSVQLKIKDINFNQTFDFGGEDGKVEKIDP